MITFNATGSVWIVVTLLVAVFIPVCWLEWKRKLRYRNFRLAALTSMMVALAGVFLRPGYSAEQSTSIALLTPGFSPAAVDSLLEREGDLRLLHAPGTESYRQSTLVETNNGLQQNGSSIRYILGEGLPQHALDLITEKNYEFIPCKFPDGIIEIYTRTPVRSGRENSVEGVYNNPQRETWLYLEGPGGSEDSVVINGSGRQPFRLSFYPKQVGSYLYSIIIKSGEEVVGRERIPIVVEKPEPLSVFMIQDYPTFETQNLKNYLARNNHQVTLRYRLSADIYRYEYLNSPPRAIKTLTPEVLASMDLLLMDSEAVKSLSRSEITALLDAIRTGLGLIILPDGMPGVNEGNSLFPFTMIDVTTDTAFVVVKDKKLVMPALPTRVNRSSSVVSLVESSTGLLSGYSFVGAGKIGFQLVKQSYRLALAGDSSTYSQLWVPLLEGVARVTTKDTKMEVRSTFPIYPDFPLTVTLISNREDILLMEDSIRIPLREDVLLDGKWTSTFPAGQTGWHELLTNDGIGIPYYISEHNEWKALSSANQLRATWASAKKSDGEGSGKGLVHKEIDPLIFYLQFLLSAGFIWLTPKL